ncbi:MAG: alkaline phosphatase [Alistipes sp.]|nr:alkaline phosphatase [Alistipes sp.]
MKRSLKFTICCLGFSIACLCVGLLLQTNDGSLFKKRPKYIFYFIGDGMGLNHILGTEQFFAAKEGKSEVERLNFSKFQTRNFVTNYSVSNPVTDSAAAGTALATGRKTANTSIGVDADGNELRNLTDVAVEQGYKVGLVTNVGINHATPSCFYGHTSNRFGFPKLIDDYIASDVSFIAGAMIMDVKSGPATKAKPVTSEQLAERIRNAGILLTCDIEEAAKTENRRVALVANDKKNQHVVYVLDREGNEKHTLINHSKAAIEYMSREAKDGFFLMIEGGKLDYAAHEQDAVATFLEVNEFAQCIDLALAFAAEHPDETLIVVTSDHETGGMALGWDHYEIRMDQLMAQKMSAIKMTLKFRKMRAEGKRDWDDYKQVLSEGFGLWSLVPVSKEEEESLKRDFYDIFLKYGPMVSGLYNQSEFVVYNAIRLLNKKASIDWTSLYHTGQYTPLFANGVGEREFLECRDQTDIPKTIASLMGGSL